MKRDDDKHERRTAVDKVADESDRALLILDMSVERVRGSAAVVGANQIVRFIQGELRYFRERGRLVVFANTVGDNQQDDVVIPELTPRSNEVRMRLSSPSAFFDTNLHELLQKQAVRRLTLVGLETHTAVLQTASDAFARGYEVVVPDPCVCANDDVAHQAALLLLRTSWTSTAQLSDVGLVASTSVLLRRDL